MQHRTTTTPKPASEAGALAGWAIDCEDCGRVGASSMQSSAKIEARQHSEWGQARAGDK